MPIHFVALETAIARKLQAGEVDAYGNRPVRRISEGGAIPCRHCLKPVAAGEAYLTLSYRPFDNLQPYAETGPIFLHADACERAEDSNEPAAMFRHGGDYILRGYDARGWIDYKVAEVVPADRLAERAQAMLDKPDVAYLHMRSSRFNCYQCRIERAA